MYGLYLKLFVNLFAETINTSRQGAENEGGALDFKIANSRSGFSSLAHDESAVGSNREILKRSSTLDRQVAGGNIESTELAAITSNSADNSTSTGGRELAVFTNVHTLERDRLVLLDSNEVARAVELRNCKTITRSVSPPDVVS